MYHFSRTIVFSVWPLQMEVIMHRGRCVFTKKRSNLTSLPKYFPKHPVLPLRPGIRWLHYRSVMSPHSPPSGRIRGRPGHESAAPSWLEASGATALGRHADCKVCRVAKSQTLAVSWLLRLCTLSLCLSLRASISNCPWGTIITLRSPSAAPLFTALLLCSAFNHQPIKPRGFSTTVQSGLLYFASSQTPPVKNWTHLSKTHE